MLKVFTWPSIVECLKQKNLQVSRIMGMGFDGASTFSGKKSGVQTRIKKLAPHALAVCAAVGLCSSRHAMPLLESSMFIQHSLFYGNFSITHLKEQNKSRVYLICQKWRSSSLPIPAHERCIKASYSAIVTALHNTHCSTHEPEALGLSKVLGKQMTIAAMFLLDYTLPQVAKLSKTLQTESLDLSTLVDSTLLHSKKE